MTEYAGWHQRIGQRYELEGGIPVMWGASRKGSPTLSRLVNLSVSGAGIVVPDDSPTTIGDELELTVGETSISVKVREIRDLESAGTTYYGVQFITPIPAELIQVLNEVIDAEDANQLEEVWNRAG
jgi:hypothetical protein